MKYLICVSLLIISSAFCLPDGTWSKIANADEDFHLPLPGFRIIRYGDGTNWRYFQDSNYGRCSKDYFGWYFFPLITECQMFTPTDLFTVPTKPKNGGPSVDVSKIPPGNGGYSENRIQQLGPTDPPPVPAFDGVGAFRISCDYSHMLFDDPIVFPGQPGESHLHMFFGNTGINAYSTTESILTSGDSTCPGGIINRSGYWVAPVIDTRDGTPLMSTTSIFYYKTGYHGISAKWVQDLPHGLRMIAGNPKAMSSSDGLGEWECRDYNGYFDRSNHIVNCKVGQRLHAGIEFPQCWDGVNLDSPDHKSHMAYPVNNACPLTHPVAIPVITININWAIKEENAALYWRLSSDMYDESEPGGYSFHADWWNGWNETIMHQWMENCDRAGYDCHASLVGNNQMLY